MVVELSDRPVFVKTTGETGEPMAGSPVPYFDHAGPSRPLRNAIKLASSCDHPALSACST